MNDPKLITFIVAAVGVGLYMAWDAGLFKFIRLPWGGSKEVTAEQAIEAAKVLARYYAAKGNAPVAVTIKAYAAQIFEGTL